MVSFEQARAMILESVSPLEAEQAELLESLGRVTAEEEITAFDLPSFSNSAMDGYAVRAADCGDSVSLPIVDYIPAGGVTRVELTPGHAIKIMTGAPVPRGADAVVPLEDAIEADATEADRQIRVTVPVRLGQHIRRAGEDVRRGETLIPVGTLIRVAEICMLASQGRKYVQVFRRPQVAILANGDELLEPGQPLSEGKIYDSNSVTLAAAVKELGAIPLILGFASDERESLRQKIEEGLQADVLITAAGVSVGDRDFIREILAEFGVKELFWKVNIRPGKAMAFGINGQKPVFALPGNPVSAMITFEELVRPALLKMMGHRQPVQPLVTATLQEDLHKKPGKIFFMRLRLELHAGKLFAWNAGKQETGILHSMRLADGVALLAADRSVFSAGEQIKVRLLTNMLNIAEVASEQSKLS